MNKWYSFSFDNSEHAEFFLTPNKIAASLHEMFYTSFFGHISRIAFYKAIIANDCLCFQ